MHLIFILINTGVCISTEHSNITQQVQCMSITYNAILTVNSRIFYINGFTDYVSYLCKKGYMLFTMIWNYTTAGLLFRQIREIDIFQLFLQVCTRIQ